MAPKKKAQKISLNEFLGDSALGSWADEMESLPNAPATRTDEDRPRDRHARNDHSMAMRLDRGATLPRDDVPLPTHPPFTAFVGNLSFDLTEVELERFFGTTPTKTIKIIRDRDEKPKGFGYVEFVDLGGLKEALLKNGTNFCGRTVRISVAEPVKERAGFTGGEDDAKFDSPWRRERPPPERPDSRDSSRRRFDVSIGSDRPSLSDGAADWRSGRPLIQTPEHAAPPFKRKGFSIEGPSNSDDAFGAKFPRGPVELARSKDSLVAADEPDWRTSGRRSITRDNVSSTMSTPSTPQASRRKLELLPRSASTSSTSSPLSSPKLSSTSRPNPFGEAKPVDVTSREKEVEDRLEKERDSIRDRHPHAMSRSNSRTGSERGLVSRSRTPPPAGSSPSVSAPSTIEDAKPSIIVRPSLSFANVASGNQGGTWPPDNDTHPITTSTHVEDNLEVTV